MRHILILAVLVLLVGNAHAKQYQVYNDKGSAIVQQEGDTLYVHRPDGNTDVLFKQDDGLVYNDKGSAIVQEQGDTLFVHRQDGSTDVLFKQDE